MRMIEIFEDVTKCDYQVTKLRKMKWLVYVQYMEDERPATRIRTDALLWLNNSASNESLFFRREERLEGMTKSINPNLRNMALYLGATLVDYVMKTEYDD